MVMRDGVKSRWLRIEDSRDSDFPFWQDATPIWISAIKQGLRAGIFAWPGADVSCRSKRPILISQSHKSFINFTMFLIGSLILVAVEDYNSVHHIVVSWPLRLYSS